MPPLRERRDDIPSLVAHFVEKFSRKMGKRIDSVPRDTMIALSAYDWPGNIRELQNLIERAVILADDGVLPNPLPPVGAERVISMPAAPTLKDTERVAIVRTLETTDWVIGGSNGAAAKLGVNRTTLINKMKRLGISRPQRDASDLAVTDQF